MGDPLKTYQVPTRFGAGAMLALQTLLAVVFAVLRAYEAPLPFYLFFAALAVWIAFAQMRLKIDPRIASAAGGAVFLLLWSVGVTAFAVSVTGDFSDPGLFVCLVPASLIFGAFGGYLVGAVLAGLFLVADRLGPKPRPAPPGAFDEEVIPAEEAITAELLEPPMQRATPPPA